VNLPTNAHFHGYAHTNPLIPELVSGVQFREGPYFAEDGDFSAVKSKNINYMNQLDRPIVSVSGGGQGVGPVLRRGVAACRERVPARRDRGNSQRRSSGARR
jgi:hypothetical protein